MKVLFLNHNYENFGTYWRCYYLSKYLSLKGIDVDLVCASKKEFDLNIHIRRINDCFRIITLPRIRFHEYHTGHSFRGVLNSLLILMKDYDVLHSFAVAQPATALPTIVSKIFKNKPIIVDWDDIWGAGFGLYHAGIVNKFLYLSERYVPKCADYITLVSGFLKEKAVSYGYKNSRLIDIPNAANVDEIKTMDKNVARRALGISEDDKIILAMGHTYMGNIEAFMEVVKRIIKKDPKYKFYLVGNIGSSARSLIKDENLVITGEQPFAKVPYFLASADVLMLPMGQSDIEKARWPIRLGDYLCSGRPVVSNAVGEVKKILEEEKCGITTDPDDMKGLSDVTLDLLQRDDARKELGIRARKAAEEKYSWQVVSDKLAGLYKEII